MNVTATHTLVVARPPAVVWAYTQDFTRRPEWDPEIVEARVVRSDPLPRVEVRARGGLRGTFEYRLFDAPRRTSVVLTEVRSPLFDGGGGSWSYAACSGGTEWTVTNSLRFKSRVAHVLLGWLVERALRRGTQRGMEAARARIEAL